MNYVHGHTALSYGLLWTALDPDLDGLRPVPSRRLPTVQQWPAFAKQQYAWRMRGAA